MERVHKPVLLREVTEWLALQAGDTAIDATINGGGHTEALRVAVGPQGYILGIDRDPELIRLLKVRYQSEGVKNVELACGSFSEIADIARAHRLQNIRGILFDLGFSSYQIESSGRGFSFQSDEPLDMRYDSTGGPEAADLVNGLSVGELERVIREYGDESFARRIAEEIFKARRKKRIERTMELAGVIGRAVPAWYRHRKIHWATKTFQALRIAVNDETRHITEGVSRAIEIVAPRGRVAVISFHSLEDGIIKQLFNAEHKKGGIAIVTKKPVTPSRAEVLANPRARSAKLRVAQKQ